MNISKFIDKFFLVFFIFSSISVQGPILALGGQTDASITEQNDQNGQYNRLARELRERRKWKNFFISIAFLTVSSFGIQACARFDDTNVKVIGAVSSACCGLIGALGTYDFLEARLRES